MKYLALLIILLPATFCSSAQDTSLYLAKTYTTAEGKVLPYRILYPESYDRSKKYPLVLFLHGAGERGTENSRQLIWGSSLFLADSNRKKYPCFILAPQCPRESYWSSVKINRNTSPIDLSFDYESADITWPLQATMNLTKQLVQEEGIDKSRIYITGLSMGGMGTFEAVYRFPGVFAAALPICGGGDTVHYDKRVKKTAFWVFHGDADAVVDVNLSRNMVAKLTALEVPVKYSEYPGVNHNSWNNAFSEPSYLNWMFLHKKKKTKW